MMGSKLCAAVFAALLSLSVFAAPALPDVDAVLRYESHTVSHNGVTREMRFSERMIRREGHVWTERLIPAIFHAGHDLETPEEHAVHEQFDYDDAARLVRLDRDGKLQLDYVDPARTMVVRVPSGEFSAVGFGSSWASANALVEPAAVTRMQKLAKPSPVPGATWYGETLGKGPTAQYNRVLWSPRHQLALRIESGTVDGAVHRITTVELKPRTPDAQLPWKGLERLAQKEYDDFMD